MPKSRRKPRPTGLTVAELPLAPFHRALMDGSHQQMVETLNAAARAVRGETTGELKPSVDAVALLVDQAKMLGECELLLRLDDEALAREAAKSI